MRDLSSVGSSRKGRPASPSIGFCQVTSSVFRACPSSSITTSRRSERVAIALIFEAGATFEIDGVQVVTQVLADSAIEAAAGGEFLVALVPEPGQQQALVTECAGLVDDIDPSFRR